MAAKSPASLHGAIYWAHRLRPFNIPLPAILGDDRDARLTPFPGLILEHLPGTDATSATTIRRPQPMTSASRSSKLCSNA
jgi:hypothetical protein